MAAEVELERRRASLERRRKAAEAQIAVLQAEVAAEEAEFQALLAQEAEKLKVATQKRVEMTVRRKADLPKTEKGA